MKYKFKTVISVSAMLLGSAIFLPSCSKFRDKKDKVAEKVTEQKEQTAQKIELQGDYQSNPKGELSIRAQGVGCLLHNLEVQGNKFNIVQTAFDDANCQGRAIGKFVTETTSNVGPEVAAGTGARAIDLTITKVMVSPLDTSWGRVFGIDVSGDCNISDIPVGEVREITGKDCGKLGKFPAKDQVYFTSYRLVNEKTLEFTKLPNESMANVGTKEAPAPRNLALTIQYLKP